MKVTPTDLAGCYLIEPTVFQDERGFFFESHNEAVLAKAGIQVHFVQDNHSRSKRGVLRGMHFQTEPKAQDKLMRVIRGSVYDVVVDIRPDSNTFGSYYSVTLSAENRKMLYVPVGFAHGFLVLEDDTEFLYKVSDLYSQEHERGIIWNDPDVAIDWPKLDCEYVFSPKDAKHPRLRDAFSNT